MAITPEKISSNDQLLLDTNTNAVVGIRSGRGNGADMLPPIVTYSAPGVPSGLTDFDGNPIITGGSSTALSASANNPAANANNKTGTSTYTVETTQNRSTGFAPRFVFAGRNIKRATFKNPPTNTVSFDLGTTAVTNDVSNQPSSFDLTVAPGQQANIDFPTVQQYFRQANTSAVASQIATVELEYYV